MTETITWNLLRVPFNRIIVASQKGELDKVEDEIDNVSSDYLKRALKNEAFINACKHGHRHIFNHLLDQNVDVNYVDSYRDTPLIYTARKGYLDMFTSLLDRGAYIFSYKNIYDLNLDVIPIVKERCRRYCKIKKYTLSEPKMFLFTNYETFWIVRIIVDNYQPNLTPELVVCHIMKYLFR